MNVTDGGTDALLSDVAVGSMPRRRDGTDPSNPVRIYADGEINASLAEAELNSPILGTL
jgi:hypothetical protein